MRAKPLGLLGQSKNEGRDQEKEDAKNRRISTFERVRSPQGPGERPQDDNRTPDTAVATYMFFWDF